MVNGCSRLVADLVECGVGLFVNSNMRQLSSLQSLTLRKPKKWAIIWLDEVGHFSAQFNSE